MPLTRWLDKLLLTSWDVWEVPLETISHLQSGASSARLLFTIIGHVHNPQSPRLCHGSFLLCSFLGNLLQLTIIWEEMRECITLSKFSPCQQGCGFQGPIERGGSIEDPLRGFCPPTYIPLDRITITSSKMKLACTHA